ncbi:MAG: prolipoprotein diacylglyceryl transferase [Flavobacteriales bacterium]|nr:MAG: prolipoprotein diacylglyceryl transferase [Flavobacteriales bacterium]
MKTLKHLGKILFLVLVIFSQNLFAQDYPNALSDGKLLNGENEVPVQLFSTTRNATLYQFSSQKLDGNILVFLNKRNLEFSNNDFFNYNRSILKNFKVAGYQLLDKNFHAFDGEITTDNILSFKYLYKGKKLDEDKAIELDTQFSIWNPNIALEIGPIKLHYYSLMFVIAFGLGYILMLKMFKIDSVDEKYLEPLFTWTLIGTIFGARIGHVLFYEPELFRQDFWAVFLPIRTVPEFEFTGFSGLASHGATFALIATTLYYSLRIIKKNPFWVYDRLAITVALAGFFIRFGNFFNSEIIGKMADENSPFAVLFPQMSDEYGITVPRYPTQLFEAFGYLTLFVLLWFLYKKTDKKYQQGWLFGLFFTILWSIRFMVEFLKEPQGEEYITTGVLNTGQLLSIPFIIAGIIIMIISKKFKINNLNLK